MSNTISCGAQVGLEGLPPSETRRVTGASNSILVYIGVYSLLHNRDDPRPMGLVVVGLSLEGGSHHLYRGKAARSGREQPNL